MSSTYVIGDVHGNYNGLVESLQKMGWKENEDRLIFVGDLVDRGIAIDILPTAKAGGFLHQPPLHSNRGCCVLHDVRQALLPVCPTVRYVFIKRTFAQALYAKY